MKSKNQGGSNRVHFTEGKKLGCGFSWSSGYVDSKRKVTTDPIKVTCVNCQKYLIRKNARE